ncbi:MAG: PKD domain-containing protein [Microbacterium sp.]
MSAATVAALAISLLSPSAASAAQPSSAVLVAPSNGSTTATNAPTLSVTPSDPDGGDLQVRFEGRREGATVPGSTDEEPFTFVVIPDTQNYSDGLQATITAQAQWILDSRASLNTVFAAQVGDLVGDWFIPRQWNNVSNGFRVLDDGGMPNTVVPGNHDFDNSTGDMGPFNTYFPSTRYSAASWNTATTRYGGYLGQNQFGADPVDRGNADSYALFTAGGRDFLLLNLEWEAPQVVLDWADRVLDAHPDRIAIMATHGFLTVDGNRRASAQRPGGTSQQGLWQNFVSTHCQIRLVVSGHEHAGDLGESRRTDANACGEPVHQILSDYQSRANGGNGWLRYYTFDPAAGTMRATTYSPTLQQYETDADSSFVLPFPLAATEPAPFTTIATRTVASGSTATATWPALAYDARYEWRAVVDDGTSTSTSSTWTLRTPAAPEEVIGADAFARSLSGSWGSADTGGAWALSGGAAAFAVTGGRGVVTLAPSHTREARLGVVSTTNAVVDVQVSSDVAAAGGAVSATVVGRLVGSSSYSARVRFEAGGVLRLYLLRNETLLGSFNGTWTPGQPVNVRLSVRGTSPTALAAKMWTVGAPEPTSWQVSATDTLAELQAAGALTLKSAVSSSSTVPTTRLSWDAYRVVTGNTPPSNAAPVARITSSASGLTANVSGTTSTDSDGTIQSYSWTFGDGSTATGPTASRTYAAAGTYPVGLTVTDDDGAAHTASTTVTVTAPQANQAPVAVIGTPVVSGRSVTVSGTGSTDADGTITSYAWAFGDGATAIGPTASRTYAADGAYTITLTVTDDDGTSHSTTRAVTVAAPPGGDEVTAADAFTRTASNSWGAADTGGSWTVLGGNAAFSVAGGRGIVALSPSHTREARLNVSGTNAVVDVQVASTAASVGGTASATVTGRMVGSALYSARLRFEPNGVIRLYLLRDEVALGGGSYVLPGSYVPGEMIRLRLSVRGTSPSALGAKIWRADAAEPVTWQLQATDTTAGLQAAGTLSLKSSLSASSTAATQLRYDDFRVVTGNTTTPPPNTPPVARFTSTVSGLTASFNGSTSTDSDGTIQSHTWNFGDGTTGTGVTPTRTYTAAGTYTVTLTVRDDDNDTHTTTGTVTVTVTAPPAGQTIASDAFGRTVAGGWGSADVGGAWSALGGAAAFSVDGSRGIMTLRPADTREARLSTISRTASVVSLTLGSDVASVGGAASVTVVGRQVGASVYSARVRLEPAGVIRLYIMRDNTALGTYVLPGAYVTGERLAVKVSVTGTSPTTIAGKVWRTTGPEPAGWQLQATDATAGMQSAGWVGIIASISSSSTAATTRLSIDDVVVSAP